MGRLLKEGKYFKLVCGAGNENAEEVRRLTLIYTLAGTNGLDVSANPEVVKACVKGIEQAYELAPRFSRKIAVRPFITVSVGMPGDNHVRKAEITDRCVKKGNCLAVCPTDAITADFVVKKEACIGCGNCEAVCPPKISAVRFEHNDRTLREILPECLAAGAENIELHAAVADDESILSEWSIVCDSQPNHFVSMCLDRFHLSNLHLIKRIKQAGEIAGERLIIQADGVPMSAGSDDFNTTLQAIAIADVITKDLIRKDENFADLPILLSGGTNGKTGEMARLCDISYSGVSIGTHARKIVKKFVNNPDFDTDMQGLLEAVEIAEDLIARSIVQ